MRRSLVALPLLLFVLSGVAGAGEGTEQERMARLARMAQRRPPSTSAPPAAAARFLVDKPKLARETLARRRGLREAGNPHIPSGLLLRQIQYDDTKSRVDPGELRQQRLGVFARELQAPPAALRPEPRFRLRHRGFTRTESVGDSISWTTVSLWVALATLVGAWVRGRFRQLRAQGRQVS